MRVVLLLLMAAFMWPASSFAQAYESQLTYEKKKQKAMSMDYNFSQEAVENAIVKKIEDMGTLGKVQKGIFNKDKGFIVFKDAIVSEVSDERMDYIIKVDRKSRKEKDASSLSIILNKDGQDAIPAMDAQAIGKVKAFLSNLYPDIEEANLELQIKSQDDVVVKAEKKFKDLQDEKADLEKKLKKNQEDLERQQKEIESQRTSLDLLKGKRKVPAATNP